VIKDSGLWYYDGEYGFLMRRSTSCRNVSVPLSDAGCDWSDRCAMGCHCANRHNYLTEGRPPHRDRQCNCNPL